MKQSATLILWVFRRMFPRCRSSVYLTMLFLLSGMFLVTQKSEAQCNSFNIDFKQGANRDGGYEPGQIHWINSILQNSNSRYIEGMSTLQRIIMNNLPSCGQGYHKLRIKMQSRKGDNHAYDFLTSWDNAFAAAAAIAPGFDIFPASRNDAVNDLNECGDEIPACSKTACDLVTGGANVRDLPIIDGETNLLIENPADQNTVSQIIPEYETRYGNRTVRIYVGTEGFGGANGDVDNRVVFVGYGDANPNDDGDSYIYYDILWRSTSPNVVIEYGAHIAVGVDGLPDINAGDGSSLGVGYLLNRGASAINGGPYHCIVEDFQPTTNNDPKCEPNLGNLDNQLQGSQVLLIPECELQGPTAVCANGIATYTAAVTNPSGATYLWEIINSNQAPPPASIIGTASGNVPDVPEGQTSVPLTITVNTGGVGTYTVKLTINNGAQSGNTTDDDIASSCTVTTTVSGGPSITCPTNTTVAACLTQAQVDAAYQAWLATVSAGATHNGGTVGPLACGGAKTVTFTATNFCGTATCAATFTVTNAPAVTLSCASNTTIPACRTQAQVDAAYTAWLATATASGGCGLGPVTNNGGSAPSACGGSKTVTFTVTSSCESPKTCSATFTVTAAPAVTLNCATNTTIAACQTQGQVDAAYGAWLATATASGGCGLGSVTNNGGSAPAACGGSKTVTFSVTSSCEGVKTCSATFTVTAAPAVTLTCASNTTIPACRTQAQVDAAYTAWLATATASGGCGLGSVTNNGGSAPSACGGAKTVTFTVTSACETPRTCSATFTVTNAPAVTLTCPANTTITPAPGATQQSIDNAFAAWLASASASGGCSLGSVTNNNTGAPPVCGGQRTVTFSVTSSCEGVKTCSATFTVNSTSAVTLNCASNTTIPACRTQAQVDAAYTAWLATATASGGSNLGPVTNNGGSAPAACGGAKTVTFTVTSSCEAPKTCSATFTVTAAPAVTLTCASNTTIPACRTQAQVDAAYTAWLATASASGGCGLGTVTNNGGSAPAACGGAKTVTFTVTSSCEAPKTCSATFTVTAAPAVTLTCATNTTIAACQTQGQVDAAYGAWLATATASGGCGLGTVTNNGGSAPAACGGAKTVTFSVTSSCEGVKTCSATFTVTAAPAVTLTCASNTTIPACRTQAQVDAAYTAWLATASASGGCGLGTVTNNGGSAPAACGGAKTVTFTVTSSCETPRTCSATFTVTAAPAVTLTCASNTTIPACRTQAQVDAAYTAWLATASASGGCGLGTVTNNGGSAPAACGGSKTVTFSVTSSCEAVKTCSATFTVTTAPAVTLTCASNTTLPACRTQAQVDAAYTAWLATATASGGCGLGTVTNNGGSAPAACGGSKTVTFSVTSSCEAVKTCSATFTVTTDNTPPVITCPANFVAECGATPVFGNPSASDNCGGATTTQVGTDQVSGVCPTVYTRTWRATDACGNTSTCSQTITVPCCSANCTYTMGYYGNEGGTSCDGTSSSNNPYTTEELIEHSLLAYGGLLRVGCEGRSVNIATGDADCVISLLPIGGPSGPLPAGSGNVSICDLSNVKNTLLGQTITLGLNLGINPPNLGNFALEANKWLVTADLVECGSTTVKPCEFSCTPNLLVPGTYIWAVTYTPYRVSDCKISQALYDALTTKNVQGLYALANSALCGNALPAGVSYGDLANALGCINEAFDECAAFVEWRSGDRPTPQSYCTLPSATTPCPAPPTRMITQPIVEATSDVSALRVTAYPNPFTDRVRFLIRSSVSGQGSLEIYNMLGQKIETVYNGTIVAERSQTVEYKTSTKLNGGLIYIFRVGGKQATGKLLKIEQ